jgi:glycosyltransferase involved in cell wall biosynthesis
VADVPSSPADWPDLTIVMPVRQEADAIERSLGAVLAQDYPGSFEVLVADGASTDGTRAVLDRVAAADDRVSVLDNPDRIVPTGLNRALARARGEVVIRIDGHCEVPPDYARRCVVALLATGADCAGGVLHTEGSSREARAVALAQSSPLGVGGARFRTGAGAPQYVDTLAFGAYRREVFDRIGLFDEELVRNQDDEFNLRLTQAGGRIWLDPTIQSTYWSRATVRGAFRQYFQYGTYKVRVAQKRRTLPSVRSLVPAALVAALAGGAVVGAARRDARVALAPVATYALGTVAAAVLESRRDPGAAPLAPPAFAALHLGYGAGVWWGLWRFRGHFGR